MFKDCINLAEIDLRCSMTKTMRTANQMFKNCPKLMRLPEYFVFGGSSSGYIETFSECSTLTDISSKGTKFYPINDKLSGQETLSRMFEYTNDINFAIDIKIPSTVIDTSYMFYNSKTKSAIGEVETGLWFEYDNNQLSKLEDCNSMFKNCYELSGISTKFSMPSATISEDNVSYKPLKSCASMFENCYNILKLKNPEFRLPFSLDYTSMFKNCYKMIYCIGDYQTDGSLKHPFPTFDWNNYSELELIKMRDMFYNCYNLIGTISGETIWNLDNEYNKFYPFNAFYACARLENFEDIPYYWGGSKYPYNLTVVTINKHNHSFRSTISQ